jgi:hypothetical protein
MHSNRDASCCRPIDLQSKDAGLPTQSSLGSDAPPSETRMQKMINDRYGSPTDAQAGMKSSKKSGIPEGS